MTSVQADHLEYKLDPSVKIKEIEINNGKARIGIKKII